MRNAFIASGLMIALLIAGAAWTMQPSTAALVASVPADWAHRTTLTGRVISVGASGHIVTIEAANESTDVNAITVGDSVEVLRQSAGAPSSTGTLSRRLLGLCCLAVFGAIVAFRARRPLTI